eukprot:TRINITY_DN20786_c0_g2_i1.p1 TRINITY_DN20786_c0_g2~~TRINITY_DN20786_c0_g2_i1.p1  ORF type:complete len:150 (+),score=51.90 TRINITY_DN20786_c0_g2_i1:1-450(+)
MQESLNRTKSFYSSMNSKLHQAEPESSPEMLQAQHNEAVRSGRVPTKRSPSRQNYDKINTPSELPGSLKILPNNNPEGWSTKLGSTATNSMAQNLWRRASDAKVGIDRQLMNIASQSQQQRAGAKETLDELEECLNTELFLGDLSLIHI